MSLERDIKKTVENGEEFLLGSFIGESEEELENIPLVVIDEIREVEFAIMYNGKIYDNKEEYNDARKDSVRSVRDSLLKEEVDPVVTNPLRWADLSEEEKTLYTNYRRYLLDYTKEENWWEQNPKTMNEWKE